MDEQRLRRVLEQDVEVPDMINKKLEQTYARLEGGQRPAKRRGARPVRVMLIAAAAVALLVTTVAAATVPGLSQRLLAYLGVKPEDAHAAELLVPGAMPVDITVEDNGASLHVTQVLRDRASIMVLADFTAPEGTSLYLGDPDSKGKGSEGFYGGEHYFMDEAGEKIDLGIYHNYFYQWEILEDDDPADNHLSAMFTVRLPRGDALRGKAASMRLPVGSLLYSVWDEESPRFIEAYSGEWSCDVPLPQKDIGWMQRVDDPVGEMDGAKIMVKELYVSPVNLLVTLGREGGGNLSGDAELRWLDLLNAEDITLRDGDGNLVPLGPDYLGSGSIGNEESVMMFRLSGITDPARIQGGSITLDLRCGLVTIPLDNLAPAK